MISKSGDIRAYAKWLAMACREAGLNAEQYGGEILVQGVSNHLSERLTCGPDVAGVLRWHWSWGRPICRLGASSEPLGVEEIDDLVRAIKNVVSIEVRPR